MNEISELVDEVRALKVEIASLHKFVHMGLRRGLYADYRLWAGARAMLGLEVNELSERAQRQWGHGYSFSDGPFPGFTDDPTTPQQPR